MRIHIATLCDWKNRFSEFSDALKRGFAPVDNEVESALLRRALGYDYEETTTEIHETADGQRKHIKKVTRHVQPDVTAQIFWLKNRRPDLWRDKPVATVAEADDPLMQMLKRWDDAARQ